MWAWLARFSGVRSCKENIATPACRLSVASPVVLTKYLLVLLYTRCTSSPWGQQTPPRRCTSSPSHQLTYTPCKSYKYLYTSYVSIVQVSYTPRFGLTPPLACDLRLCKSHNSRPSPRCVTYTYTEVFLTWLYSLVYTLESYLCCFRLSTSTLHCLKPRPYLYCRIVLNVEHATRADYPA